MGHKFEPPARHDRKVINVPAQVTYVTYGNSKTIIRGRVIRNGMPNKPYLPKDPGRRRRLLNKLGISDDSAAAD